jgi:K+-sensing histidine kinase KdpD
VLTSHLTSRVRDQADAARRRERRTAALYAFAREIAAAAAVEDLLRVVVEHIGRQFRAQAVSDARWRWLTVRAAIAGGELPEADGDGHPGC